MVASEGLEPFYLPVMSRLLLPVELRGLNLGYSLESHCTRPDFA